MRIFYERLHDLHRAAGEPSMREIQRGTRTAHRPKGINPTTIHDAFSSPKLARWDVVEAIVRRLGGEPSEFAVLWHAAGAAAALDRAGVAAEDPQPDHRTEPVPS